MVRIALHLPSAAMLALAAAAFAHCGRRTHVRAAKYIIIINTVLYNNTVLYIIRDSRLCIIHRVLGR